MRFYQLKEDKLPSKLPVRFSFQINSTIKSICDYNKNNIVGIREWSDYLNGVKSYVSYSVIAWDSTNRHIEFPNGAKFIKDFGYNVGYKILEDRTKQYSFVYIFMVNLNIEEFGLQYPLKIIEKKQYNTMNNTKKRIRLTESQLHRIIKEAINELDWKTYYDAARKGMKRVADIERENEYVQSGDAPCIAPDGTKDWWYGYRKLIPVRDKELERSERFAEKARQEFKKKYPNSETYNYPMNVRHLTPGHRGHSSDFTFSEVGNPDRDDYESYWQEVGINESIHRAIRKVLR